ncbi:helix-turn-helix domain-containing protein [Microbacterium rhizophilus]|uniref:helix-turn-helix domain-containing protein n=1 Tax=Microbacterium rhizophilus TaxID=3138934 RepID=UPI0031EF8BDE
MTMIQIEASTLPDLLAATRRLLGLSMRAMGERLGVAHTTIAAWEHGVSEPSFSQVVTWARLTGQPLSVFVDALGRDYQSEG